MATVTAAGCQANPADAQPGALQGEQIFAYPRADAGHRRLANVDNGLELRHWVVRVESDAIGSVMRRYEAGEAVDDETRRRLERNGLRLIRIAEEDVDSLLHELGRPIMDVTSWQGQIYEWRELHRRAIDPSRPTLAIDGRVRRIGGSGSGRAASGGQVRLMMRGWILPMEDGPRLQLELVPQIHDPQAIAGGGPYRRLIGRDATSGETIRSLAIDLLLEDGYAYLLTCEEPGISWEAAARPNHENDKESGEANDDEDGAVGPRAVTPLTIGEHLMRPPAFGDRPRAERTVYVFIPRIARELFPADEDVPAAAHRRSAGGAP